MRNTTHLFAKPRLLIVGCGDIGLRVVEQLAPAFHIFALTSQLTRFPALREAGALPILGNLDQPDSLWRLSGLAATVIHLAPPPNSGNQDRRTRNLLRILAQGGGVVRRLIYVSTTGVYGDANGSWVHETTPIDPQSERAQRRVDAEQVLRTFALTQQASLTILRVPGIYDLNRLPIERLKAGTPALLAAEDAYSNHIQSDDLSRLICAAVFRGRPQRIVNACDGEELKMGDYFDQVADAYELERPPRLTAAAVKEKVSPMLWSFMRESRRVSNTRLKELKIALRYPNVASFISKHPLVPPSD